MARRSDSGSLLQDLVALAVPFCCQAELLVPRTGPGRRPDIPDWLLAVLIMVAVLKRKKTKSAQYCFLCAHRDDLALAEWTKIGVRLADLLWACFSSVLK